MLSSRFLRVVVLPALLLAATAGLGCYYETNDDLSITLLLQGSTAAAPVTDLHLYFHGLAPLLAALYQQWPGLPWYGLTLYGLLYAATGLAFAVLDKLLRTRLPARFLVLVLLGFYALAWLEHGLWFSYVRVPVLLAGSALLLAAQRLGRRRILAVALLAVVLAGLIRPSAAGLGLLVAAPGAMWLAGRRGASLAGGALALVVVGSGVLALTSSALVANYRTLDVLKSNLNDYQLYQPTAHTSTTDQLGLTAVGHWAFGDSTLVNQALFARSTRLQPDYFLPAVLPAKLTTLGSLLVRDYFALLLLQVLLWLRVAQSQRYPHRQRFWLAQLAVLGLLVGLGGLLKLPPRLGMPICSLWLLSNLAYVFQDSRRQLPRFSPAFFAVLILLLLAYAFKTTHRVQVLRQERARGLAVLLPLQTLTQQGQLLVAAGLESAYKSQSPFQVLHFAPGSVVALTGWPTLDPSQAPLREQLTGTRHWPTALTRLAARPQAQWWLAPEIVPWLQAYWSAHGWRATLQSYAPAVPTAAGLPQHYRVRVEKMK
ncbi:hypothetical protein [Hymenobacter metallicola]|uniref:Glycosyltransferase RgtA/B/C/D-like domain-containing protein n=1 Tax=Hymenobacter metallicola TaxID=2563114 RepID=A0A4Z0QGP7_9BACT|nr:hypothetical protein [Hymenobacter metallicola]TGE28895.1 hypothetical protein E5K02_05385 [Hymenobacter metallicola]